MGIVRNPAGVDETRKGAALGVFADDKYYTLSVFIFLKESAIMR